MGSLFILSLISVLCAVGAGGASAAPVTSVGDNVEIFSALVSVNSENLSVLAGRRSSGDVFGTFMEVGIIVVPITGGQGKFIKIPELDGSNGVDFQHAFSRKGDLYYAKTAGTGALRIGKMRHGRVVGGSIVLPSEFNTGDFMVKNIVPLDDGGLDIAVHSASNGVLISTKPDLSLKTVRSIRNSADFQGLLRRPGNSAGFLVVKSSGTDAFTGGLTVALELRSPDLTEILERHQVKGMPSIPVQIPDGARIALSTLSVYPGLATAHLYNASLAPVNKLVVVSKQSYYRSIGVLLSDSCLVTLHVDDGKCYATVMDSRDGHQLARREVTDVPDRRCINVSGAIVAMRLVIVTTYRTATVNGAGTSMVTRVVPL